MATSIFIVGISTEVGKTMISSIVTESLEADYWKPVQSGDLDNSDTDKVKRLISNSKTKFHPNSVALSTPASPHLAAQIDGVELNKSKIHRPKTDNHVVIEGAGGLMVPLNENEMMVDLIQPSDKIIVVSRHYLGSINHTLMTIETLRNRNLNPSGIIFSGNKKPSTEELILNYAQIEMLGRLEEEPYIDKAVVKEYAEKWNSNLLKLI